MTIESGLLLNSPDTLFGDLYVPDIIPKAFAGGFMYDGSGMLLFGGSCLGAGSKVFSVGFLLSPETSGNLIFGDIYAKVYQNKIYVPSFITTTSARPGLSSDTGFLLVNGFYTDFEANPRTLLAGDLVEFTDYTYGPSISGWYWNFGDGNFSTDQYPVHAYTVAGLYTVELTVTSINSEQVSNRKPNYISVTELAAGKKKLYMVATNQRVSTYKMGTLDKIQIKFQMYSNNRAKLSYLRDVPISLRLNYNGWQTYETGVTDKFGNFTFFHVCNDVTVDNCLGYVVAVIDNEVYRSNVVRLNFTGE